MLQKVICKFMFSIEYHFFHIILFQVYDIYKYIGLPLIPNVKAYHAFHSTLDWVDKEIKENPFALLVYALSQPFTYTYVTYLIGRYWTDWLVNCRVDVTGRYCTVDDKRWIDGAQDMEWERIEKRWDGEERRKAVKGQPEKWQEKGMREIWVGRRGSNPADRNWQWVKQSGVRFVPVASHYSRVREFVYVRRAGPKRTGEMPWTCPLPISAITHRFTGNEISTLVWTNISETRASPRPYSVGREWWTGVRVYMAHERKRMRLKGMSETAMGLWHRRRGLKCPRSLPYSSTCRVRIFCIGL